MKVVLRNWREADAAALAGFSNNIKIWNNVRDMLPYPYTLKHAEEWIAFTKTQQPASNFAVEANGLPVGSIGFLTKEDVYRRNIEIGYFINETYWNKGIASLAVAQLVEMLIKQFHPVRIFAAVFENNIGSMRVLEKNGFHLECIHRKAVYKNDQLMDEYCWVRIFEDQL